MAETRQDVNIYQRVDEVTGETEELFLGRDWRKSNATTF